jgi:hypothetical protein
MMGKKRLAAVREDIAKEFAKSGLDAKTWFTERIRSLEKERKPDPREVETLNLLREALRAAEENTVATPDA